MSTADRGAHKIGGGLESDAATEGRIDELTTRLANYRARYYAGEPEISDAAYDALEDELRHLAPAHPLLAKVGSPVVVESWAKAPHEIPMGSLNKAVGADELREWAERCNELLAKQGHGPIDSGLIVTEKLDGISVELLYREGKLVAGITRGDGLEGELITPNVARMRGVLARVAERRPVSVRGEIILRLSDMREHFPGATSPRNVAAGTARRFDGVGTERLTVLVYDLAGEVAFPTEEAKLARLRELGFATPNVYTGGFAQVLELHRRYETELRQGLDYEIDGLVVRVDDLGVQARLGEVNHRPRGAVAFKFASPAKVTQVVEIVWDTGPSGRVTPVAVVEPVQLAGASVQRASLHNAALVRSLGIGVGDEVLVSRRNDVIPYVEEVVTRRGKPTEPPSRCGRCQAPLVAEGEYLLCRNEQCPALVAGRLRNWIDATGALEWGDKLVEQLVDSGLVREPRELYGLREDVLAALELQGRKLGAKRAKTVLGELRSRLPLSLPAFLAALGIEGFGLQTARLLTSAGYESLESILGANEQQLAALHGLGETKAALLVAGLRRRAEEIARLVAAGLGPSAAQASGPLAGKSFCLTGALSKPRKHYVALIERQGGRVLGAVTQELDYLVMADPESGSSKAVKARRYGTKVLSEAELLGLLGAEPRARS